MKIFSPKQLLVKIGVLLTILLTFYACQKEITGPDAVVPPPVTTVKAASISGFVTDESNSAVSGASVKIGNTTIISDKYGYFEAKNVDVEEEAGLITISKTGYFKGIKNYIAKEGKSAFFRIKLIPKTLAGVFAATAGGTVTTTTGVKIVFPAGAIVAAASGAAYSGNVSVAAHWIDPISSDLNNTMPGDLRGIDVQGNTKKLITYGMVAVELTGASGELLQIAPGKKASLSAPIPAAISGTAPASIPLWYFDETTGFWKEEGNAVKNGNEYTGDVSHFSFWNYDVPANFVQLNCTLKNAAGHPLSFTLVKICVVSNPQNASWGYTDSSGYVSGAVPANSQLKLEVFPGNTCNTSVYTQVITSTTTNISLGTITVNIPATNSATISGTVTNCANGPVTSGYVIVYVNNTIYRYATSNTGTYSFTHILCSGPETAGFVAEDLTSGQQNSSSTNFTISSGVNTIPNIKACGVSTEQFFTYTINGGTPKTFTSDTPADSIYFSNGTNISVGGFTNGTNNNASVRFNASGIANGSSQNLVDFSAYNLADSLELSAPVNVNITEYGAVGQFISGNFTGTFNKTTAPPASYTVVCNFRVRR